MMIILMLCVLERHVGEGEKNLTCSKFKLTFSSHIGAALQLSTLSWFFLIALYPIVCYDLWLGSYVMLNSSCQADSQLTKALASLTTSSIHSLSSVQLLPILESSLSSSCFHFSSTNHDRQAKCKRDNEGRILNEDFNNWSCSKLYWIKNSYF